MNTDREHPPYLPALLTAVVVFLIYLATLAPTTAFWDTSEYIAAAKVLGIPHPPGNPLFVILAHTFGLLPLALGVSFSRVYNGVHYPSDIEASRRIAYVVFGYMMATPKFQQDLVAAKAEMRPKLGLAGK